MSMTRVRTAYPSEAPTAFNAVSAIQNPSRHAPGGRPFRKQALDRPGMFRRRMVTVPRGGRREHTERAGRMAADHARERKRHTGAGPAYLALLPPANPVAADRAKVRHPIPRRHPGLRAAAVLAAHGLEPPGE
jgi:hypothetical protein